MMVPAPSQHWVHCNLLLKCILIASAEAVSSKACLNNTSCRNAGCWILPIVMRTSTTPSNEYRSLPHKLCQARPARTMPASVVPAPSHDWAHCDHVFKYILGLLRKRRKGNTCISNTSKYDFCSWPLLNALQPHAQVNSDHHSVKGVKRRLQRQCQ